MEVLNPAPALRVSLVAPTTEDNLAQLSTLVSQINVSGAITDSQNRRMVAFLGTIEELRTQLVIMVQRYEYDERALKRLLALLDRIDETKDIAYRTQFGVSSDNVVFVDEAAIERRYDVPTNPIQVSNADMIGVSGMDVDPIALYGQEQEYSIWSDDEEAPLDDLLRELNDVNLEQNELEKDLVSLNNSFKSTHSIRTSSASASASGSGSGSGSSAKNEMADRKGKKASEPILCKICYDEYTSWDELHEFTQCGHTYCNDCLRQYLTTSITEGAVLDLYCPCPNCETEVTPFEVRSLVSAELMAKYEKFVLIASLRADPNARMCPFPDCSNVIVLENLEVTHALCTLCGFDFCLSCSEERHDGVTCGDEARAIHNGFVEWTKQAKKVKPCPKCKMFIEKTEGCNHMTCNCKQEFCWLCGAIYTYEHFMDMENFPNCYEKQYWMDPEEMLPPPPPPSRSRRARKMAAKVGIYVGLGMAVVTLGVPAAVVGGPIYGCFKLHKALKVRRQERREIRNRAETQRHVRDMGPEIRRATLEAARLRALEEEVIRDNPRFGRAN